MHGTVGAIVEVAIVAPWNSY